MNLEIKLMIILHIILIFILKQNHQIVKKKGVKGMCEKLSPWCKKAKVAMIMKDIDTGMLATALGYARPYVSSVLNGRTVSPPARKRISDFLNISDSDDDK